MTEGDNRLTRLCPLQEFTLGFYDGITGLVIHPYQGAKHDGTAGLLKGVVRGFGGLLLKTQAGMSASYHCECEPVFWSKSSNTNESHFSRRVGDPGILVQGYSQRAAQNERAGHP